ncbi:hypothetical protein MPRS_07820 [Mycobacterium paraseoulense]|nr:hypothetical protein MPRS_07820 [Mycobacterium paraseoulense]
MVSIGLLRESLRGRHKSGRAGSPSPVDWPDDNKRMTSTGRAAEGTSRRRWKRRLLRAAINAAGKPNRRFRRHFDVAERPAAPAGPKMGALSIPAHPAPDPAARRFWPSGGDGGPPGNRDERRRAVIPGAKLLPEKRYQTEMSPRPDRHSAYSHGKFLPETTITSDKGQV